MAWIMRPFEAYSYTLKQDTPQYNSQYYFS
jgi:hypothetical protein